MQCFHQAPATVPPTQPRVLVSGLPVATIDGIIAVTGCPFVVALKPQPCVLVKWLMPSTRFLVAGKPALLDPQPGPGPGICQSAEQIPQGAPIVTVFQMRVTGM
jgi:hypothetical protein